MSSKTVYEIFRINAVENRLTLGYILVYKNINYKITWRDERREIFEVCIKLTLCFLDVADKTCVTNIA